MRIVVLSNLYPPYYMGGYELACQDAVESLKAKGHDVFVITSTYNVDRPRMENRVYRWVALNWFADPVLAPWWYGWTQFRDSRRVIELIRNLKPDVLYVWGMARLELLVMRLLDVFSGKGDQCGRKQTIPMVFAISDRWLLGSDNQYQHWVNYWKHIPPNPIKQLIKSGVKQVVKRYLPVEQMKPCIRYGQFFSQSLQQQHANNGIVPKHVRIIYHGVPIDKYVMQKKNSDVDYQKGMRLLYCGQLAEPKGVHTAVEALAILVHQKQLTNIHLTIVGPHEYSEYVNRLYRLIEQQDLQKAVTAYKMIPREQLEGMFNNHDVFIFPSIWEEPFSIVLLEAMAHGLSVISTPTGGSREILRDRENCLIFPAGDAHTLANRIELLMQQPELTHRLSLNAVETIRSQYSLAHVTGQMERYLTEIIKKYECEI